MPSKGKTTFSDNPELTASQFSALVGADRHEIAKKLNENGAQSTGKKGPGLLYGLRDLINAHLGGDEKAERIRKLRAESEKLEVANARQRGELVPVASVKKLGQKVMGAVKIKILNFPLTDDEKDQCLRDLLTLGDKDWGGE